MKQADKHLRQSFLQLDSLKADAQLEAAVGTITNGNLTGTMSNAGAAGVANSAAGVAGVASSAAGAAGAGSVAGAADAADAAAGATGAVAIAANAPAVHGDTAVPPVVLHKRRRKERNPQPRQHPHPPRPLPLAAVRHGGGSSSNYASTSGGSTGGASSARNIRDENDPSTGVSPPGVNRPLHPSRMKLSVPPPPSSLTAATATPVMSPRRLSTSLEQRPEKEASVGQGGEMASSFRRAGSPYQASREVPQATPACGRGYRQGELPCEETKAGHVERRTRLRVGEGSGGDSGGDVDGEPLPPGLVGELPVLGLPIALPLPSPSPLTRAATIEQKGGLGSMPSPLRRRRSSMKSREQPGFAVVGLVGTYGERVLLLPTGKRKKRLAVGVGAAVAGAVVDDDGEGSAASDGEMCVLYVPYVLLRRT